MSSNSETGHAKNAANFKNVLAFIIGCGATYNPFSNNIKLAQLQTQNGLIDTAFKDLYDLEAVFDKAVDARRLVFEGVRSYASRIIGALAGCGANQKTLDNAAGINRKLNGRRSGGKQTLADAGVKKEDEETTKEKEAEAKDAEKPEQANKPPKKISVSQQSIDYIIEHFSKLTALADAEPTYNPNETDLTIINVKAFLTSMKDANNNVETAQTNLTNARIERDKILYNPETGVSATAQQVKNYIKSVYGPSSPQYKKVNSIKFKSRGN